MKKILILLLVIGCAFSETIRIGTAADFAPFEYEENGQIKGFDIDLANELSKRVGFDITLEKVSYGKICDKINQSELDIGISSFGNDLYTLDCFHSVSYFESDLLFVKLKSRTDLQSKADLRDKSVAYDKDSKSSSKIITELEAKGVAKESDKLISMLLLLQEGKVDSIVLDSINSGILIENYPFLDDKDKKTIENIKQLGGKLDDFEVFHKQRGTDSETFIIFPKDGRLDDLKNKINLEIMKMREDGTMGKMLQKYYIQHF